MSNQSDSQDRYLELSQNAAAGDPSPETGEARLAGVLRAFQSAAAEQGTDSPPELFRWRHLRVLEKIGEGTFGEVYRAFDPTLNREVALKLSRGEVVSEQQTLMQAEARRMARLRHPHILAVHGTDVDDSRAGIWSDLLRGKTLAQSVAEGGGLAKTEFLPLALALTGAVSMMHRRGVIHGDLKPANIMLTAEGPVITDFGSGSTEPLRQPRAGSPMAMAPELFDRGSLSLASDIYSLGVVFCFALTGRYPLAGTALKGLMEAHRSRQKPDLRGLPRDIARVVAACLSTEPSARPSGERLAAMLGRIQSAPRRRRQRAALALVIGSLSIALLASLYGQSRASRAERAAQVSEQRAKASLDFLAGALVSARPDEKGPDTRVLDLLNQASRDLQQSSLGQAEQVRLNLILGESFRSVDAWDLARKHFAQVVSLTQGAPDQDTDRLQALFNLAILDRLERRFEENLQKLNEVEQAARRSGNQDQQMSARIERAITQFEQGHPTDARDLLESLLPQARQLPESGRHVSKIQRFLANIYRDEGRPGAAVAAAQEALAIRERIHGADSMRALAARTDLSTALYMDGKYEEAGQAIAANLEILDEIWPGPSSARITQRSNLTIVQAALGKVEEAAETSAALVAEGEALFGRGSRFHISLLTNHGSRLFDAERFDEAAKVTEDALTLALDNVAPEHPSVLMLSANLSEYLLYAGHTSKALELAVDTLSASGQELGEEHLISMFVADIAAAARARSGDAPAAVGLLQDNRERKRSTLGPDNPMVDDTTAYLVEALLLSGDTTAARREAEDLLPRRVASLGRDSRQAGVARSLLQRATGATAD